MQQISQVLAPQRVQADLNRLNSVGQIEKSSFKDILSGAKTAETGLEESLIKGASSVIDQFSSEWLGGIRQSAKILENLPSDIRPLFETQLLVNKLALRAQVLTKAAETANGTLRRLEQLGSR